MGPTTRQRKCDSGSRRFFTGDMLSNKKFRARNLAGLLHADQPIAGIFHRHGVSAAQMLADPAQVERLIVHPEAAPFVMELAEVFRVD